MYSTLNIVSSTRSPCISRWLEYASSGGKLDDPFQSERHALEFSTWQDLMDTVRARIMAGEKSHLENAAYLPQLVVGKNKKGEPIRANFMYAIKCHKVHDKGGGEMPETNSTRQSVSIPFKRFRATSELHT